MAGAKERDQMRASVATIWSETMRTNLIAAVLASGCLLGFQASAFAQGAAAYPNTAPVLTGPTTIVPDSRAGTYVRVRPAQPYYDQYGDYYGRYRRQSR
jgi:hypothetical protein